MCVCEREREVCVRERESLCGQVNSVIAGMQTSVHSRVHRFYCSAKLCIWPLPIATKREKGQEREFIVSEGSVSLASTTTTNTLIEP